MGLHATELAKRLQLHFSIPFCIIASSSKQDGRPFLKGLRKSRYEGTNRGTKGTVVNQTLLLLPRFPYKNIILSRYLDFRIGKKPKSRYKLVRRVKTLFLSKKETRRRR